MMSALRAMTSLNRAGRAMIVACTRTGVPADVLIRPGGQGLVNGGHRGILRS